MRAPYSVSLYQTTHLELAAGYTNVESGMNVVCVDKVLILKDRTCSDLDKSVS